MSTLTKPTLVNKSAAALAFAESKKPKPSDADKRVFYAPEGYRRLTVNLREDLHKKLRMMAIEQDCTATDIIERLLVKELT
jgi:hypothetical protein